MLSWITGPRITSVADDLHEPSLVEPPETPAPIFAYRALKHAVFGTPAPPPILQPESTVVAVKTTQPASRPVSPTKPQGILMTPGTAVARRKQVTFGSQVVDNEGKKPTRASKSGIPDDCPGKYPSPFTPKTDVAPEAKSRTRLTAAFYQAKSNNDGDPAKKPELEAEIVHVGHVSEESAPVLPRPHPDSKRRPRRISIISTVEQQDTMQQPHNTIPPERPSSSSAASSSSSQSCEANPNPEISYEPDSAEYWKAFHTSYAAKSERETKRLIKKASIAKDFAKQKDAECTELRTKLADDRKRHKSREKELLSQTKDYQERLRTALAENGRCNAEIANLKKRLADVEVTGTAGFEADAFTSRSPVKTDRLRISREGGSKVTSPRKYRSPEKQSTRIAAMSDLWEDQAVQLPNTEASQCGVPLSVVDSKENQVIEEEEKIIIAKISAGEPKAAQSTKSKLLHMPGDRLALAKEKIAARKAQRAAEKENGKPLR